MNRTSIKDFKIERELGKGSFGSVYLVRRQKDNKIYALKTVILEKLNKKEQENSVNEVRILASVNHQNVIGYKEAFWDDAESSLNIVMEYADDGDLQTKISKMRKAGGLFSEEIIWSYAIQMIEGLKALHDKKIMHRDLKSANIFLVKDKHQCKIGDMNVSKVIKEKVLLTQTGTPYYASPEVWKDQPYSYKSDLWSIGCVIYELCALKPPFHGKDLDELFENVCKGNPERINSIYSDDLWKMILMLLQVDVDKRVDCNQFLSSKLIKRKIEEMKKNPNTMLEGIILDKNKETQDNFLLETIKFSNISELKAQLPTKKNYAAPLGVIKHNKSINSKFKHKYSVSKDLLTNENNKNDDILQKLQDINKEKEKIKAKQIEYNKIKNYLHKKKEKEKEKVKPRPEQPKASIKINNKRLINSINNDQENSTLKNNESAVVYRKKKNKYLDGKTNTNSNRDSFVFSLNKDSIKKIENTSNKKHKIKEFSMNFIKKEPTGTELYSKKYIPKICNSQYDLLVEKNRAKTPLAGAEILNNKFCLPVVPKTLKRKNKIPFNCISMHRNNNSINIEKTNEISETESNYIYNKPTKIIIKKKTYTKNCLSPSNRPGSISPVYSRVPLLNPNLFKSNIVNYNSCRRSPKNKRKDVSEMSNSNQYTSKTILTQENEKANNNSKYFKPKLSRYHSYAVANGADDKNESEKVQTFGNSPQREKNNHKSFVKKLVVKSYKKLIPKTKNTVNREKEVDEKLNFKYGNQKKIKFVLGNPNIIDSPNSFLKRNKDNNSSNDNNINNSVLNCYLSPKSNNSQIFNNFYSINYAENMNVPVKVINVYKK